MKEKNLERVSQTNKRTSQNQAQPQKSHQISSHQGCVLRGILGTILEMNEGRTSTNRPQDKKTNDDA